MSACEKCWRDASMRALLLGGSVVDHYRDLLKERADKPCTAEQHLSKTRLESAPDHVGDPVHDHRPAEDGPKR